MDNDYTTTSTTKVQAKQAIHTIRQYHCLHCAFKTSCASNLTQHLHTHSTSMCKYSGMLTLLKQCNLVQYRINKHLKLLFSGHTFLPSSTLSTASTTSTPPMSS